MKEIEILVKVNDSKEKIKNALSKFEYKGEKRIVDKYFYDPMRDNLKPDDNLRLKECLRIRNKNNKTLMTYKVDHFEEDTWIYSDEYEEEIESFEIAEKIFEKLGLKELITINNLKSTYVTDKYEIVFEEVENLGYFMEVEYSTDNDVDIKDVKSEIQRFIDELKLDVSEELNMGKPEMMLRKKYSNI